MSRDELDALSHDLFSVGVPSIKHTLSHRTGWPHPEAVTAVFIWCICPKQTHADSSKGSVSLRLGRHQHNKLLAWCDVQKPDRKEQLRHCSVRCNLVAAGMIHPKFDLKEGL